MFRGLFGSNDNKSPAPPKNQIEVVCPACGAAQYESRLAVSTFCKRCGVHLKIEKKRVIASDVSRAGGRPEALEPKRSVEPTPSTARPATGALPGPKPMTGSLTPITSSLAPLGRVPVPSPLSQVPTHATMPVVDLADTGELGLGMMMQAASGPLIVESAPPVEASAPAVIEADSQPPDIVIEQPEPEAVDALAGFVGAAPMSLAEIMQGPAAGSSTPGTFQKMRDQGMYRAQHHFKEAECFECHNKFKVGRSSKSANCPSCGAYISMEDIDLNMPSTQPIKTRGDVMIRKRGHLTATHLFAKELRCFGLVSANIQCSGDAIFKTSGTIVGEVHCKKFIVEKGSDIEFLNEVRADEIEIAAPVKGHFYSKGPLIISATGAVDGSVTGRSISIEPGGELNGSMNIVRAQS